MKGIQFLIDARDYLRERAGNVRDKRDDGPVLVRIARADGLFCLNLAAIPVASLHADSGILAHGEQPVGVFVKPFDFISTNLPQFFGGDELLRSIGFGIWPCFKVGKLHLDTGKDCLGKQNERSKAVCS